MISKETYLRNPCRAASLPLWKAGCITVPDHMRILHEDDFSEQMLMEYTDEPYFRLCQDLQNLSVPVMPQGFSLCDATLKDYAEHINQCYDGIGITEAELQSYITRPVYDKALWLALKDDKTGAIAATGIAELDREIGEGVLEWIQVSKEYRGCGIGSYLVSELLWRMKGIVKFATVSGQCHNPTNPEGLYRRCGFTGKDVWHILTRK